MKIIKFILWTLLIVVGLIFIYSLIASGNYNVEKSIVIEAPRDIVFEETVHWDNFQEWSPWSEMDPNMEVNYEGDFAQVGSIYTWSGNDDTGKGMQEITYIDDDSVGISLRFIEPFESEADNYYTFDDHDGGVKVTWGMSSELSWPMNVMSNYFKNSIGHDFEKGLETLKSRCDSIVEHHVVNNYRIREVDLPTQKYIGKKGRMKWSDMASFNANTYRNLYPALAKAGIQPTGPATNLYFVWDEEKQMTEMMVALPIDASAEEIRGFDYLTVEGGKALQTDHIGNYEGLAAPHEAMDQYIKKHNIDAGDVAIEVYLTNPEEVEDPAEWHTRIIYPLN